MTLARKFEICLFGAVAFFTSQSVRGCVLEREARIRAESSQQANDKVIAADQTAIKARDAAALQSTAALAAQAAALHTGQQAAQIIVRYLPAPAAAPGGPATAVPPIPTVSRAELPTAVQAELPPAPSYGVLTQDQLIAQARKDLSCEASEIQLTACTKDGADLRTELAAESATAHAWEAAAKGGTKFQRLVHVTKLIGCAGAGAGLGALAGQKSPAIGAAAGAGFGVTACSLF